MIPSTAHFIWYGARLPYVYQLSLRAARIWGGFAEVILHHDAAFRPDSLDPHLSEGVTLRSIDAGADIEAIEGLGPRLMDLYQQLSAPAARANLLRMCVLAKHGGVYLDTDALCIRPMAPVLKAGAFCGEERILFPGTMMRAMAPRAWARSLVLSGARWALRELPGGFRHFRRIEPYFPRAVNNAVVGAQSHHPFVEGMLQAMVDLPPERRLRRFALGTHLLQQRVSLYSGDDLVVHAPEVFYPLAPEISRHWFRVQRAQLDEVLSEQTRVVHWYASVRLASITDSLDAAYLRNHREDQLFSRLVSDLL